MSSHRTKKNTSFLHVAGVLVLIGVLVLGGWFLFTSSSSSLLPVPDSACRSADRSSYGVDSAVFSRLPSLPACILSVSDSFNNRQFTDSFFFAPDYYLQPEFYPSFFTEGLSKFTSPVATHYGAVGYGAFPHEWVVPRDSSRVHSTRIFFHSGFGVRSFQAGSLDVEFAIPEDAGHVVVSLDSSSSEGFFLGPSFPIFHPSWVKPVDVSVSVKPSAPYREIVVYLVTRPPSSSFMDSVSPIAGSLYSLTDWVGSQRVITLVIRPS